MTFLKKHSRDKILTEKNETLRGGLDEISVEKKAKKGSMRSTRNDKESIIRDL